MISLLSRSEYAIPLASMPSDFFDRTRSTPVIFNVFVFLAVAISL